MRPRWRVVAAVAAPAAISCLVRAQEPARFRADTRLVVLHVTVRNSRGALVTDLDRSAFTVYENGQRQPITLFRRDDLPVSVGILIDNSGSMRPVRARVEAAALAFARASNPDDEMFVINFADRARLDVPMTSDIRALEAGVARADAIGGTAMHDAIDLAETYLDEHATRDRKALVVITDGNDNASETTLDRIRTRAAERDLVIYGIGLLSGDDPAKAKRAHHELDQLAERTGGAVVYPSTIDDIDGLALDIAHQIRNQYTIAYTPLNQALDGAYRPIRVTIAGGERLWIRTRAGYRATPTPRDR